MEEVCPTIAGLVQAARSPVAPSFSMWHPLVLRILSKVYGILSSSGFPVPGWLLVFLLAQGEPAPPEAGPQHSFPNPDSQPGAHRQKDKRAVGLGRGTEPGPQWAGVAAPDFSQADVKQLERSRL